MAQQLTLGIISVGWFQSHLKLRVDKHAGDCAATYGIASLGTVNDERPFG